jgi:pimeloyl-ACP methyl ester carboxylesterase
MLRKPSRSRYFDIRQVRYHVREWGPDDAPALLMLHGWMDVSASFQFVVDALANDWRVLAPDWRGYGRSAWTSADCYWFPDYLADLEFLADALLSEQQLRLVGHSMGGNVALMYAGIRPARVAGVVNLEGFGLRDTSATLAPERYARWIDELKSRPTLRDYASLAEVAQRLRQTNPRLPLEAAGFLAEHWSEPMPDGRFRVAGDPAHRIVNPVLYRLAEVEACWARVTCPVLWVEAAQTDAHKWAGGADEIERRRRAVPRMQCAVVEDAGHMLHHDQPGRVAALIEAFFGVAPRTA